MERNELYLKTAFCCMACDGTIAPKELSLLKSMVTDDNLFKGLDIQGVINAYVSSINQEGELFLHHYLDEVKDANLDDESALKLIKIAIETIEVDNQIEYSEISFFKKIRKMLAVSDESILEVMPDKEDYLLPDIESNDTFDWSYSFESIHFPETKA